MPLSLQALAAIEAASDSSASHNCWAYRVGSDVRSADDGEPGGTAGRPILAAINGEGLDRVCVLVTRCCSWVLSKEHVQARQRAAMASELRLQMDPLPTWLTGLLVSDDPNNNVALPRNLSWLCRLSDDFCSHVDLPSTLHHT